MATLIRKPNDTRACTRTRARAIASEVCLEGIHIYGCGTCGEGFDVCICETLVLHSVVLCYMYRFVQRLCAGDVANAAAAATVLWHTP